MKKRSSRMSTHMKRALRCWKTVSWQEIQVEFRGNERLVGNIYKGRVENILPGMQAAFVDVGLDKKRFLYAGDILADKSDFEFPGERQNVDRELKTPTSSIF